MEENDPMGFLSEQSGGPEEPASEPVEAKATAAEETAAARERDASGRFARKGEAPPEPQAPQAEAQAPQPDAPPAPAAPPEPGHVPLSAVLDERERRQAAERELAELKARREPPPQLTDDQRVQAASYTQKMIFSRKFAEREYGRELIDQVHAWAEKRCDADPSFNDQMFSSPDPYEEAVQAFNRERVLATVSAGDLEAFQAWKAAQAAARSGASPQPPAAQAAAPRPPRSLATAPGNGSMGAAHVPVGEGAAFDNLSAAFNH